MSCGNIDLKQGGKCWLWSRGIGTYKYEQLLEDLIEKYEESERKTEESSSDKKVQDQEDKKKAMHIRKKTMETYGETRRL